jgi:hypothetical protein
MNFISINICRKFSLSIKSIFMLKFDVIPTGLLTRKAYSVGSDEFDLT